MDVSVLHPGELGPAELDRWRALQQGNPLLANPFLSPEFTLAVGRIRHNARVGVLTEDREVVGFFPYELHAFGVAGPIGAGLSDCQGLIHAEGWEWDPHALLAECHLAVWEFDHLIADQKPFSPYHAVRARSPIIDLREGYEAYLDGRRHASKKTIKSTLYKGRKLERDHGEAHFDFDCRDPEALRQLMQWKSAQYRRTLRHNRFANPAIVRMVSDLFTNRTAECAATLSMLSVGGRPIAGHLGLCSGSVLACWFPAYDVEFAAYSPGLLIHLEMAKAAAAAKIQYLDLGKGPQEYKDSLCSGELTVAEGWVERPSPVALIRRLQRAPRHHTVQFIMNRPALLSSARKTLKQLGRLRSKG
jgi:CelD/BcsL family acetyltransferase involved in cellulose biosynthesis